MQKDTLIILQCCKSKSINENYPNEYYDLLKHVPYTHEVLEKGIKKLTREGIINNLTLPVSALGLYTGHFYRTPNIKRMIANEIKHGPYQFLIMSAGYGFVHPFQKIHNYEARMAGKLTTYWLRNGLPRVLQEFSSKYKRVYGVFSKSADYKKIFEHVNWNELTNITEAGYFTLDGIRGASKVLQYQAILLLNLIDNGFSKKPNKFREADVFFHLTA